MNGIPSVPIDRVTGEPATIYTPPEDVVTGYWVLVAPGYWVVSTADPVGPEVES